MYILLFVCKWTYNIIFSIYFYNNFAFVYWRLNDSVEQTQQKSIVLLVIFVRHYH